jgi:hypothetical protein
MDLVFGFRRHNRETTPTTDPLHGQAGGAPVPECDRGRELPVGARDATADDFSYVECNVPEGMTLDEYRRSRPNR